MAREPVIFLYSVPAARVLARPHSHADRGVDGGAASLVAVAVIDPRLAATFARMSFLVIGARRRRLHAVSRPARPGPRTVADPDVDSVPGLDLRRRRRAHGAAVGRRRRLGLVAGLVLIVVLIGFTVTQFAFRSLEPLYGARPATQLRALAVDGAGAAVWEWNARRDEIKVSPVVEAIARPQAGELSAKMDDFTKHLHPADRERFRLMLWSIQERAGGKIRTDFRMRHADNYLPLVRAGGRQRARPATAAACAASA